MKALKKTIGVVLASVLTFLAPGSGFYGVLAQEVVLRPVGAGVQVGPLGPLGGPGLQPGNAGGSGPSLAAGNLSGSGLTSSLPLQGAPVSGARARGGDILSGGAADQVLAGSPELYAIEAAAYPPQAGGAILPESNRRVVPSDADPSAVLLRRIAGEAASGEETVPARKRALTNLLKAPVILKAPAPPSASLEYAAGRAGSDFQALLGGVSRPLASGVETGGDSGQGRDARGPPQEIRWPSRPGQGRVIEAEGTFLAHEITIARYLAAEGHEVRALPEDASDGQRRHPDSLVDGGKVEFKSRLPEESPERRRRHRTDYQWIVKTVKASLGKDPRHRHHGSQARVIILDARGSSLSADQVTFAAWQLSRYIGSHLDSIRVIGDGFDKAYGSWPAPSRPTASGVVPDGPASGEGKVVGRQASGLAPPLPTPGPLSLEDYRYPFWRGLGLDLTKALHLSFYAASAAALLYGLGIPGLIGPLVAGVQILAAVVARHVSGTAASASGGPELASAATLMTALLQRLGLDPAARAPQLEFATHESFEGAFSDGVGIRPGSVIGLDGEMASRPPHQLAAVMAHELGHLELGDNSPIKWLRVPGETWRLIAKFFKHSVLIGAALHFAALLAAGQFGLDASWLSWEPAAAAVSFPLALLGLTSGFHLTRQYEYRADHFAAWLTHPLWFAEFLREDLLRSRSFPQGAAAAMDRFLHRVFLSSYPTQESRIARLEQMAGASGSPRGPPAPPSPPASGGLAQSGDSRPLASGIFDRLWKKAPPKLPALSYAARVERIDFDGRDYRINGRAAEVIGKGNTKIVFAHPEDPRLAVKLFKKLFPHHTSLEEKRWEHGNVRALAPFGVVPRLVEQGGVQVGEDALGYLVHERVVGTDLETVTPLKLTLVRELFDRLIDLGVELQDLRPFKVRENLWVGTTASDPALKAYLVDVDCSIGKKSRAELTALYDGLYRALARELPR